MKLSYLATCWGFALTQFLLLAGTAQGQSAPTLPPPRLALVIGNSSYEQGPLRNPVNDADDMAAALGELGFEVILKKNVGHQEMEDAVRSFGQRLRRGGVGLFYFAGHGVQVDNVNYLIPVGSGIRLQAEVKFKAVPLGQVLDWMGDAVAEDRLNIVVLDACRNNPFPVGDRSPTRGLVATRAPVGTLIAYAAAPGAVAEDGGPAERNGRFTKHLLRALTVTGLKIEDIVKRTRTAVVAETGGAQVPWSQSSLVGEFVPRPGPRIDVGRSATVGTLEVTVDQARARVRVGGIREETTTLPETLTFRNIPIGEYSVVVSKEGFESFRQTVRVARGKTASLSARLKRRPHRPGEQEVETLAEARFARRFIPKNSFRMGSPTDEPGRMNNETPHQVTLTRPFWMLETEVTQGQWQRVMGTTPSLFWSCGADCPVEGVSWFDAVAFANELSELAGLEECYRLRCSGKAGVDLSCSEVGLTGLDCKGWRLPTEAEWEYAARAETESALYTGELTIRGDNDGPELDEITWYGGNSGVDYQGAVACAEWPEKQYPVQKSCGTHPVGRKKANAWGLHDMLGNVWEWVWDRFGDYPSGEATDPDGPARGSLRVLRGGSWHSYVRICRSAHRFANVPSGRDYTIGFRLVRTASE